MPIKYSVTYNAMNALQVMDRYWKEVIQGSTLNNDMKGSVSFRYRGHLKEWTHECKKCLQYIHTEACIMNETLSDNARNNNANYQIRTQILNLLNMTVVVNYSSWPMVAYLEAIKGGLKIELINYILLIYFLHSGLHKNLRIWVICFVNRTQKLQINHIAGFGVWVNALVSKAN